jgi:hypothetical protein
MHEDCFDELIHYDWTSEQAHAVVNFLEDLAEAIWSRYGPAISRDLLTPPVLLAGSPHQLRLPLPPRWWHRDTTVPF